jgi:diamine N-acetyltransferase
MNKMISTVHLRALEPEDVDLLYTIENDEGQWDVCDFPMHYSRMALRRYLALQPQDIAEAGELRLVIEADGRAVGTIDLVNYSLVDARAEVCISLQKACRQQGIGKKAVEQLEKYAGTYLHLRLLYARVSAGRNEVCHNLFKSCGYLEAACLPLWHRYGYDYEDLVVYQKILQKSAE